MFEEFDNSDICALATPQGTSAIAVIRTTGPECLSKLDRIFVSKGQTGALASTLGYRMRFGLIMDADVVVDEVLVAVFRAPHSYTGEESAEIYCHGSNYVIGKIMETLLSNGFRMAQPGEFSKRAFLNGKMDLAQTEAVADLISSETAAAHNLAIKQMRGGFSNELKEMRQEMLNLLSLMELELDFSEEEVEFAERSQLRSLLLQVKEHTDALAHSFSLGNAIKNGIPVAIVGATNTGKSTLLNALCGEEKAIVSNVHGTTRDAIEDLVNIGGTMFRFIDTAGIRETLDTVEIIGIERTFAKLREASVVIMVLDATEPHAFESSLYDLSKRIEQQNKHIIVVLNKIDLISPLSLLFPEGALENHPATSLPDAVTDLVDSVLELSSQLFSSAPQVLLLSAKQRRGIKELKERLLSYPKSLAATNSSQTIVTNLRHYEALKEASLALGQALDAMADGLPTDLVAEDIRSAIYHLGAIVGEIGTEEVLGSIFGRFCIGK